MKKPVELDILGKKIKVVWYTSKPQNPLFKQASALGLSKADFSVIEITDDGQSKAQQRDTLLHEAIHLYDRDLKLGLEEEQVQRLGTCIYQLLKSNPHFTKWIIK